jgi:hypothetical protein
MWETTDLDWQPLEYRKLKIGSRGIPHLAKNERDMGHTLFSPGASAIAANLSTPIVRLGVA